MSILPKRGTTSQISAAATANTLVPGEVIYDTTTNSLSVAVSSNSAPALSAGKTYAIGETITSAQDPGALWLLADGRRVSQATYASLYSSTGHKYSPVRYPWTPIKISDPEQPTSLVYGLSWSPDGRWLVAALDNSPFMAIYDWQSGSPVKVANPSTLPTDDGLSVTWSPDGRYMVIGSYASPRVLIYDMSTGTPVKISDPATLPTGQVKGVSFSPNGRYLAAAHGITPYVTIYDWQSGSPVKITNPSTLPPADGQSSSWSPNSQYLVITNTTSASPYVTFYNFASGTPVKITNPATLPPDIAMSSAWSANGRYTAVTHYTTPFVTIYDWSTGSPVKITNPATLPAGTGISSSWSSDGKYLAVGHSTSPFITIYDWTSSLPVKISNPSSLPSSTVYSCAFSPNGRYLAVGSSSSPYLIIYDGAERPATDFYLPKYSVTGGVKTYVKAAPDDTVFLKLAPDGVSGSGATTQSTLTRTVLKSATLYHEISATGAQVYVNTAIDSVQSNVVYFNGGVVTYATQTTTVTAGQTLSYNFRNPSTGATTGTITIRSGNSSGQVLDTITFSMTGGAP